MGLENLLGRFSEEEQEFLREVKRPRINNAQSSESRGGMMTVGRRMESRFNFLPSEDEINEYISNSLRSLFGDGE